jgi:nitrite reductase/ring-hydroxylating ferredoxin subunit
MTRWIEAARADAIEEEAVLGVTIEGTPLALCRIGDRFHAVGDICTHGRAKLSDGVLKPEDCTIECPLHAGEFDLVTGEAVAPPARKPIRVYPVRVEDGVVLVEWE